MQVIGALAALAFLSFAAHGAEPATKSAPDRIQELSDRLDAGNLSVDDTREILRILMRQAIASGQAASEKAPEPQTASEGDKVIAVYGDRNSTKLVIESRRPLVTGAPVYAGPREAEVTLFDLLSRSGDLYYYAASAPGKVPVQQGDAVVTRRSRKLQTPHPLRFKVAETYTFQQKWAGEVTAVQEGRAMIDRGTLHEVRERDIYKVLDASGARKGFLEIHGIGDLQSSGVLYNRFGERHGKSQQSSPGDRVLFLGQRKLFALGAFYGLSLGGREEFGVTESASGEGLVWELMFRDGWGIEALFGRYHRSFSAGQTFRTGLPGPVQTVRQNLRWDASYRFPVALKKNFFFPATLSPYVLLGAAYYQSSMEKRDQSDIIGGQYSLFGGSSRSGIAPMIGAGLELYPTRIIRPRIDARWFTGPETRVDDKGFRADKLFLSFYILSAW